MKMRIASIAGLLVMAGLVARASAELKKDIEYGRAGDLSLKLDVSTPDGPGPFPVAIIVHGGGWHGGDKATDITPLFKPLNDAHFVWYSINYRLTPTYRWPAQIDDLNTAIRWVKSHAGEFHGDPNRIVLLGHSAGGQMVTFAATQDSPDTRVQAIVGMSPVTDFEFDLERRGGLSSNYQNLLNRPQAVTDESRRLLRDVSPLNHIHAGMCPILIIHGSADTNVRHPQSEAFVEKLKAAGVPCELITVKDAPHSVMDWDKTDPSWKDKMVAWLKARFETK
jgi:alpha-L-fucosidase 2